MDAVPLPWAAVTMESTLPPISLGRLFLRFLRFGFLAWGGPVAQIGLIKHELVDRERWITADYFNRTLAVYQMLPGPEAAELCVFFGYQRRGRIGGLLAGLGFMLPGFLLMLGLSWLYVTYGLEAALLGALFYGLKPAVAALVVLAVVRIARTALTDPWLMGIALGAFLATSLGGVGFFLVLAGSGAAYLVVKSGRLDALWPSRSAFLFVLPLGLPLVALSLPELVPFFWSGLKGGLLTFGGAYTLIPFLQQDGVYNNGWLTNSQYLDGLALGGILPAPLVIFSTFVGYVGGGLPGSLALSLGIWSPAFSFTLLGHRWLERLVHHPRWQVFLAGMTAGVVGLIAAAALDLGAAALVDVPSGMLALLAIGILVRWPSGVGVLAGVLVPGAVGAAAKLLVFG